MPKIPLKPDPRVPPTVQKIPPGSRRGKALPPVPKPPPIPATPPSPPLNNALAPMPMPIPQQNNALAAQLQDYYDRTMRQWQAENAAFQQQVDNPAAQAAHAAGYQANVAKYTQGLKEAMALANSGQFGPEHLELLKQYVAGDSLAKEAVGEFQMQTKQLAGQNQALADFRNQLEKQQFGGIGLSLSEALASNGGDIGNLNRFFGEQEAKTFNTQLKPLIQMALGAQGLSDSGAQVELQSKALAQLEQVRQQNMMQAALEARGQLQGLKRSDILGDIGYQQQMQSNQFDLARARITMQFQQQLEYQRDQLARELSSRQGGGGGLGGILGMGGGMAGGAALGFMAGGPAGALMGAGIGGMLGGGIGNYADPNQNYGALANIPSGFFAAGSMVNSNTGTSDKWGGNPWTKWNTPIGYGPGSSYLSPQLSLLGPYAGRGTF